VSLYDETADPAASPGLGTTVVVLTVVAGLLAAASIALALLAKSQRDDRDAFATSRDAALSAGRQLILNLDALSAATIDADMKRVAHAATGTFYKQFTGSQADLKKYVVDRKTVSTGKILSAGVVRSDTDTATVLVAVDRTVKDSTSKAGVVAHDRWKMDLEKHGGRWLVADLQPVA
jgi:Mce-associated membrane protein